MTYRPTFHVLRYAMGSPSSCLSTPDPIHKPSRTSPQNVNVTHGQAVRPSTNTFHLPITATDNDPSIRQGSMASASRIQMQLTTNDILSAADLQSFRESQPQKEDGVIHSAAGNSEHDSSEVMDIGVDHDVDDEGYYDERERRLLEQYLPLTLQVSSGSESTTSMAAMEWKKGDMLGRGAYGTVYMGLNQFSGELMAVKEVQIVPNNGVVRQQNGVRGADQYVQSLESEIAVLSKLSHPNIVKYIGTQRDDKNLYIFLEYISGGSISSLLKTFGSFDENVVRIYTKQILEGLQYLHCHRIIHRDIKGGNILIDNNGIPKLADFGAAKKLADISDTAANPKSLHGTPYWMAPEVIKQTGHGRHADIWSLGCTVIEMLTGKPPWHQFKTQVSALFHIASTNKPPQLPSSLSPTARSFILKCLQREPRRRWNAFKLLHHPFISSVAIECPQNVSLQMLSPMKSSNVISSNSNYQNTVSPTTSNTDHSQHRYQQIDTLDTMERLEDHSSDEMPSNHPQRQNHSVSDVPLLAQQHPLHSQYQNKRPSLPLQGNEDLYPSNGTVPRSNSHPRLSEFVESPINKSSFRFKSRPSEADRKVISQYLIDQYRQKRDHLSGDFKESYVRGHTPDKDHRKRPSPLRISNHNSHHHHNSVVSRLSAKRQIPTDMAIEAVFRSTRVKPHSAGSIPMESPINDTSNVILMSADNS